MLDPVRVLENNNCGVHHLLTPWHVAMEGLLMSAVHGMPAVSPLPQQLSTSTTRLLYTMKQGQSVSKPCETVQVKDADLSCPVTRVKSGAVILTEANLQSTKTLKCHGLTIIKNKILFTDADYLKITELAENYSLQHESTVYYFSCNLVELLFTPQVCDFCKVAKCQINKINYWNFKPDSTASTSEDMPDDDRMSTVSDDGTGCNSLSHVSAQVDSVLDKISNFFNRVHEKLSDQHNCSLFPSEPINIIHCESISSIAHKEIHAIQNEYPNVIFSSEPLYGVLIPVVYRFNEGLQNIYHSRPSLQTANINADTLSGIEVFCLRTFRADYEISIKTRTRDWLAAANSLLRKHGSDLRGNSVGKPMLT